MATAWAGCKHHGAHRVWSRGTKSNSAPLVISFIVSDIVGNWPNSFIILPRDN